MPNDPPTISYAVTNDGQAWQVACGEQALGRFPTRYRAFEAAVGLAEGAVRDGRRAEVVCEAASETLGPNLQRFPVNAGDNPES